MFIDSFNDSSVEGVVHSLNIDYEPKTQKHKTNRPQYSFSEYFKVILNYINKYFIKYKFLKLIYLLKSTKIFKICIQDICK